VSGSAAPFAALLAVLAGWQWNLPPGFPRPRVPADNPMSALKVELGRRLFYDRRLSANNTQACGSCHQPARAFTDGRAHAQGSTGALHPRSAMSLANVAFSASLTWADPRQRTLEEQARVPLLNQHPVEMGMRGHEQEILDRLAAEPLYRQLFRQSFPAEPRPLNLRNVCRAIACFERNIVSGNSPYDRLVWKDERGALSPAALRGMRLFFSQRLRCGQCHGGFTFSGPADFEGAPPARPAFANNGLDGNPPLRDPGLFSVSQRAGDEGRFRAPTLRNIAVTAPYMHDGRLATLGEVVDHYARGGTPSRNRSPLLKGFAISAAQKSDLIAFLESLTDREFLSDPRLGDPWSADQASRSGAAQQPTRRQPALGR
jgi:cytochrome c peroxidase